MEAGRQGRVLALGGFVLLAALLAVWMTTPSRPRGAAIAPTRFAAGRAMRDVAMIGARPHVAGSAADAAVIAYLARRLRGMGLQVAVDRVPIAGRDRARLARWAGALPAHVTTANVVGVLAGRDRRAPAVVLMAHHDTVLGSPGAADDGAGVASILEIVRALRTGPVPQRDVMVLLTGGEELGLTGAHAAFDPPADVSRVGTVLNFETRGGGGRTLMFETGRDNGADVRLFARAVPWPSASSLSVTLYRLLPNSTDLTPVIARGLPGYNFAFTGRAALYHSPLATPARLDRGALQDMGDQGLALARALAAAPALPPRATDRALSDLWGTWLIDYPLWGGWLLLALAAVGAGVAGWRASARWQLREALGGLTLAPALVVGGGLLLFVANRLSGAGPAANYYDRLAALPRLEMQAGLVGVAVLAAIAAWARGGWGAWLGLFAAMWLLGAATQALLPGGGPLIHWPLLATAAAMLLASRGDAALDRPAAQAAVALIGGAAAAQALGYAHLAFLAIGGPRAEVALAGLLPVVLLAWPLLAGAVPRRRGALAVAIPLLAALAIATWVRLDPLAASVPAYSIDK